MLDIIRSASPPRTGEPAAGTDLPPGRPAMQPDPPPTPPAPQPRSRASRWPLWLAAGLLLLPLGVGLWLWANRPRLSEAEVRTLVHTTIQRETAEHFLVTGSLHATGTTTVVSRRRLLPGLLDVNLNVTRARVRLPARITYGIDVKRLRPELIRVHGDTLVEVALPPVEVWGVESNLEELEIETDRGWIRLGGETRDAVARRALASVERGLRRQAEQHVRSSVQPRLNTARALEGLLAPVLEAAGMEDPRFRFRVAQGVVSETER